MKKKEKLKEINIIKIEKCNKKDWKRKENYKRNIIRK